MARKRNYSMNDQSISAIGGVVRIPFLPFTRSDTGNIEFTDWKIDESGCEHVASTGEFVIRFPAPHHPDVKISTLTAIVIASSGHAVLPAVMPKLSLRGYSISGVAGTLMTQTDTSADPAAYETIHAINLNVPSAEGFMDLQTFECGFERESGANAQTGLKLVKLYVDLRPARSL